MPLFLGVGDEPQVVFTLRRADLRRHAGEISFPGGRRDPSDADLTETALREAEEEIGLERREARLIAELTPTSTFATNYLIHPFVALIPSGGMWRVSQSEVDTVLELSVSSLLEGRGPRQLTRRGFTFETDAFTVGEHLIWGATARILDELLSRLDSLDLGRPA